MLTSFRTNPFEVDGVIDEVVNGPLAVWFPDALVALSNAAGSAPVMSYKLNMQSPVPGVFNVTFMPPRFGLVTAFAL